MTKWDERFLKRAAEVAAWSKDPSTKVGAVITAGNRVVSEGFNGFPRGVADDERLHDRETKYLLTIHAEQNAIYFAARDLTGSTLYVHPFRPCARCAAAIIQVGIKRVVAPDYVIGRWAAEFALASAVLAEAGVQVDLV